MALKVGSVAEINLEVLVKGKPTDPSSLVLTVTPPGRDIAATICTYPGTIERTGLGQFRCLVDCTKAGTWKYRWSCPGPIAKGSSGDLYYDVSL